MMNDSASRSTKPDRRLVMASLASASLIGLVTSCALLAERDPAIPITTDKLKVFVHEKRTVKSLWLPPGAPVADEFRALIQA